MDCSAAIPLRVDGQLSIYQLEPVLHACEAQPTAPDRSFYVKPLPHIANDEMNLSGVFPELHLEVTHSTMLRCVLQGFLCNSESTQLIKIPPLHKVVRALRRASSRGFVGACVWYGHGYRRFSLQIESAHLKNCAEYQKAKQRPENV